MPSAPQTATAARIRGIAGQHGITYAETAADTWAGHVTRLAGDLIELDEIELLLLALQRAGHLSRPAALRHQVDHLRERRAIVEFDVGGTN